MTPAAYALRGRLSGLEAAFIEVALKRAAVASALRYEDVLRLVSALVDRTRQPLDKTPPQTVTELAKVISVTEDIATRVLKSLDADDVVRQRGDAKDQMTSWQLDHAYLAPPILRLERQYDKWQKLLEERARIYAEASWQQKWSALLPVATQAQLFVARLRGSLHYGQHRAYAFISLARELPFIVILGSVAGLTWVANEYEAAGQIEVQLAQSGSGEFGADEIVNGLAQVATRSAVIRWRVTHDIFNARIQARLFSSAPEPILRSLVRLDSSRFDALIREHVTAEALQQEDERLRAAAGALVGATSFAALAKDTKLAFEKVMRESLTSNSEHIDLKQIADGISKIAPTLSKDDPAIIEWLATLREVLVTSTDDRSSALSQAYVAFATRLEDGDPHAADEAAALREALLRTGNHALQLDAWPRAYAAVAARLKEGDPRAADEATALREALTDAEYISQFEPLGLAYAAVVARLKEGDPRAADEAAALREVLLKTTDPSKLSALTRAYVAVAAKLREGDARAADEAAALWEALLRTGNPLQLDAWARAYAAVAARLQEGDARAADEAAALREALLRTGNPLQLDAWARAYAAVAARLQEGDARAADVATALREVLVETEDPEQRDALASTYVAVAARLKEGDSRAADEAVSLLNVLFVAELSQARRLDASLCGCGRQAGERRSPRRGRSRRAAQ